MTQGIVVASANGSVGIEAAIDILRSGGSAIDAVVVALSLVEANPDDHSVGYSGYPNMLGQVELDASLMEGSGLRAGSVAALQDYQDAAKLARAVMDGLPHVLIVGEGARRLAAESGLEQKNLTTPESLEIWRSRAYDLATIGSAQENYYAHMRELVNAMSSDPQLVDVHGTVNFLCRDRNGEFASGVSTSGWAWKYPGRVGDSPIIGAGNYCDNRWGAAACTGRGEMAQRCCTAHSVVTFMRFGMSLDDALRQAMADLKQLDDPFASEMNIVGLDKDGNPGGASTSEGKTFVVMDESMSTWDERPRQTVDIFA
ncbi:MAG TPA: N(4)-(beta-N-acetylglucosaminyl)-L-asparaginase [Thermomicrobiales bacterium]|nr:N(4)-(beta-N-acetylglucosaminyl)-L-asparaginase [Thermomicrobiales bacterium]